MGITRNNQTGQIRVSKFFTRVTILACLPLLAGWSILDEIKGKIAEFTDEVDKIEDRIEISGKVSNRSGRDGPIVAVLLEMSGGYPRLTSDYQVSGNGAYRFFTGPGTYTVRAFVDINNDGVLQEDEPATYLGEDQGLEVEFELEKKINKKLQTLIIKQPLQESFSSNIVYDNYRALENIGRVVKLSDPMFSRTYATMGLWRPLTFSEKVGGGLFLLDEWRRNRIPVIFVHGINGTPLDWKHVIKALDREKFLPVVLYYPSGLPLDVVSEFMLNLVNKLQSKHGFGEFYIAAHSMGGLVTRSFVRKYLSGENPARIGMVMTVNSPMMGIESATRVNYLPQMVRVVPAWRDVAAGSDFIKALHKWSWPRDIPYHLVFSYLEDEAGDGVVPLKSQIPLSLQKEASGMYGFRAEHAELLKKRHFRREFNSILLDNLRKSQGLDLAASD